jgi:hypothetical protein
MRSWQLERRVIKLLGKRQWINDDVKLASHVLLETLSTTPVNPEATEVTKGQDRLICCSCHRDRAYRIVGRRVVRGEETRSGLRITLTKERRISSFSMWEKMRRGWTRLNAHLWRSTECVCERSRSLIKRKKNLTFFK